MAPSLSPSTSLLVVINLALIAAIGWRWVEGSQRDELLRSDDPGIDLNTVDLSVPASVDVGSLQSQAIFYKSRSFYVAPVAPIVEQPVPPVRLAGSMAIPNQPSAAVLLNLQSGVRTKVHVGDQIEGWTVSAVESRRVILELGARREEITNASGTTSSGMTAVSSSVAVPAVNTGVRVLSEGNTRPGTAAAAPIDSASRLYQPPPN